MTPSARVQAAIEILDQVIAATRDDGPPADALVQRYFKMRRYAGSKDRRAVRELVYLAIRAFGDPPTSGRAAFVGLADYDEFTRSFSRRRLGTEIGGLAFCFDGSPHGPAPIELGADLRPSPGTQWMRPAPLAGWASAQAVEALGGDAETALALLERAPLDLRVNAARVSRDEMIRDFPGAIKTPLSPWGIRLPTDTKIDNHPAFGTGLVEVQDEGSQLIALACAKLGGLVVDLCAGAGGKALAIAAASPEARIIACDTNRQRLSQLGPRALRAGAVIDVRLLDAGKEEAMLADLAGQADVVLVDAPCSGSGTWRRSPEGRWRLTPERLDRLTKLQARLLDIAVPLVKPGGALVYATCSILSREGAEQADAFLGRHSSWEAQDPPIDGGRRDGSGRLLTPGHDATDGFFVARFRRPC